MRVKSTFTDDNLHYVAVSVRGSHSGSTSTQTDVKLRTEKRILKAPMLLRRRPKTGWVSNYTCMANGASTWKRRPSVSTIALPHVMRDTRGCRKARVDHAEEFLVVPLKALGNDLVHGFAPGVNYAIEGVYFLSNNSDRSVRATTV